MTTATLISPRETIVDYLRSIAEHDPDGLGGVRTTVEIAAKLGCGKDGARDHLDKLVEQERIECLGVLQGEPHRPTGWKVAA